MLRILHTSDVQLDAPFHFLGDKGQRHRQQLRETFRRIVDMAAEAGFDLLLITGDLFNDNRPHQDTIDFVVSQLSRVRTVTYLGTPPESPQAILVSKAPASSVPLIIEYEVSFPDEARQE
jgi:DNA repair exonuclease SbcCD nuclease subunit